MAKTKKGSAGTKKKKPPAKKTAGKKSNTKKPASKKPAAKSAGAKKAPPKRTPAKKSPASSKTSAKKRAAAPSRKPAQKPRSGPFSRFAGVYGLLLFVLVAAGLIGGIYGWLQGTRVRDLPAAGEHAAPMADIPKKVKQFKKNSGQAAPPLRPEAGTDSLKTAPAKAAGSVNEPVPADAADSDGRPKVAIIIDDIGHRKDMAEKFFNLGARLTYAVLPYSRYQREIAEAANRRGYQVMLHLPMEPNEYPDIDPGPGALLTRMTPNERIRQLESDLAAVPHIKGVNNHMGSKMTAMSDQMNQVFTVLKKQGLFFVDSRTTSASQCRSSARLFKLPFAERDVFLDHVQTRQEIAQKIDELVNIAEIKGSAIGIGHPHEVTYAVLSEKLPELTRRVRLVSASELAD